MTSELLFMKNKKMKAFWRSENNSILTSHIKNIDMLRLIRDKEFNCFIFQNISIALIKTKTTIRQV